MNLTDREAVELKKATLGMFADETERTLASPEDQKVHEEALKSLTEYERKAVGQKRVPYRENPTLSRENLNRFTSILDGEDTVFSEDLDDPEIRTSTVGASYLSTKFKVPVEDVYGNYDSFKKALTDMHATDSFEGALRKDIEETQGKYNLIDKGYQHAFTAAVNSDSLIDSFSEFAGGKEGAIDENLSTFYGEAFKEARLAYQENSDEFEALETQVREQLIDVETIDQRGFLNTVSQLSRIEPKDRQLALTYLREKIASDGSAKKLFEQSVGQILRRIGGMSPRELVSQAEKIIGTIGPNAIGKGRMSITDIDAPGLMPEARGAFLMAQTGSILNAPLPLWRQATPEEAAQRYEMAKDVGKFAQAMIDLEGFMNESLKDSQSKNPTLNFLMEKIIYPASEMGPDMIYFAGNMAVGHRAGAAGAKLGGLSGDLVATSSKIAATGLMVKASAAQLKSEHFTNLVKANPEIDAGAALTVSEVSGNGAAVVDAMGMNFVLSRLPGLKQLIGNWKADGITSKASSFLLNTTGIIGVETLSELAQDAASSIVQDAFAAVSEDVPDLNLLEALGDTIKTAPDIALAILPYALLGGGEGARVAQESKAAILSNRAALEAMGFDEELINAVDQAETIVEKEKIFSKAFNLDTVASHVASMVPEGMSIAQFMEEGDVQTLESQMEQGLERDEPTIREKKNDKGEVSEYEVAFPAQPIQQTEEATTEEIQQSPPETFQSQSEAIDRASQWYDENGVEGLIDPLDQGAKSTARANTEEQSMRTDEPYSAENGIEEMSFQEIGMPNAGRRLVLPSKAALESDMNPKKAEVSSAQAVDALSDVIRAVGGSGAIRVGRLSKRTALGYYKPREDIIRIRTANDLETSAHEAGHALEDWLNGAAGRNNWNSTPWVSPQGLTELKKIGRDLYAKEPHNGWGSEGFAEFFRLYITDPKQAKEKLPTFYAEFEKKVSKWDKLKRSIDNAQSLGTTFLEQGALKRISSNIAKAKGRWEKLSDAGKNEVIEFERKWIEGAAVLRRFIDEARIKGSVSPDLDAYYNFRAWRNTADSRVDYMVENGMLNFAGQRVGRPLTDAFKLVQGKVDQFMVYLYAKRGVAMWVDPKGKRNPGITLEDATATVKHLETVQFIEAAQQVYDWNNGILDYAAESSPTYASVVKKIRERDPGFYIPLQRHFSEFDKRYKKGLSGSSLVKKLKGSGRQIKDPIESMLAQAKSMVLKSHQKAILDQIISVANSVEGMGHMVTEVNRDMIPTTHSATQAMSQLSGIIETLGGSLKVKAPKGKKGKDFFAELDEEIMTFFSPALMPAKEGEHPIMPVYVGDKLKWFEMDAKLYDTINGMDLYQLPRALDLFLGAPARAFRLGTTGLNAGFSLVTNPLRDFRTLQLNSQASANTGQLFMSWVGSVGELFVHTATGGRKSTEWIDLFNRLGVRMAQPLGQDSKPLKRAARRTKRGGSWSFFDSKDFVMELFQFTESAARIAEMKLVAKDMGYEPGQPLNPRIAATLANAGKQVTTDFTQAGAWAKAANQAIPFFNATIQGPVSHGRALLADPGKFILRGMVGTALALANWWRNKDEEWWIEMSLDERYAYTYVPVGDELMRMPRAFEADGFFMAGAEAMAEAWYRDNPEETTAWFTKWITGFVPTGLPVLPKIALEQSLNKDLFFDSPIVPRSEKDRIPLGEQLGPYTTNTAIFLSNLFGNNIVSPRRLDHAIRSLFGGVAVDIMAVLGRGSDKGFDQEFEPADIFALGRLFQRGGQVARNPESIDKLYDLYGESQLTKNSKVPETESQQQTRFIVQNAIQNIKLLSDVARQEKSREKRNAIKAEMIRLANQALKDNQQSKEK